MFYIPNQSIQYLNTLGNSSYSIHLGEDSFSYNFPQLLFISKKAYHHFLKTSDPFIINELPSNSPPKLTFQKFVESFKLIDLLLRNSARVEINSHNLSRFKFLSQIFKIPTLAQVCSDVTPRQPQYFKLSSQSLLSYSPPKLLKLNDIFTITIHRKE